MYNLYLYKVLRVCDNLVFTVISTPCMMTVSAVFLSNPHPFAVELVNQ